MKAHHEQKETEIDKADIKQLKKNLEVGKRDWLGLKDRVKELEVVLEMAEGCIHEIKEEASTEREEKKRKDQETRVITKKIQTLKEIEESIKLNE